MGIVELGGAGQGDLGRGATPEEKVHVIGDRQNGLGFGQLRPPRKSVRRHLVKGVQGHELQTGAGKNILLPKFFQNFGIGFFIPAIAVTEGIVGRGTIFRQKDIVHAPGVAADRIHRDFPVPELFQSGQDLGLQVAQIPTQPPVLFPHPVGEAVNLLDGDLGPLKFTQNDPAAFRAQVDGGMMGNLVHASFSCFCR